MNNNQQENIMTFVQINEWLNNGGCDVWPNDLNDGHSPHLATGASNSNSVPNTN